MKLHLCTSNDDLRPCLNHVFIDDENVVATDAHVLVIIPKTLIFEEQEIPEMYIRRSDWAKIYPHEDRVIRYDDNHLICYKKNRKTGLASTEIARIKPILKDAFEAKYSSSKFPNYRAVIPQKNTLEPIAEIGVYLSYIEKAIKGLGVKRVKLEFHGASFGFQVIPLDVSLDDCKAIVMPVML